MKYLILFIVSISILVSNNAIAWNAQGHRTVASVAYKQLTKEEQAFCDKILQSHPYYSKWKTAYKSSFGLSFEEFAFLSAATWPDEVRSGPDSDKYHHANWHYITYFASFENGVPEKPSNTAPKPSIVTQIQASIIALKGDASAEDKAISLSWLIHLIGDIHQPLHTCSLANEQYPISEGGDRGGNKVNVKVGNYKTNLHSLWDGSLGKSNKASDSVKQALMITQAHPKATFVNELKIKDANEWSLESFALAVQKAHLDGKISKMPGITSKSNPPELPADYTSQMKKVSEKQATLGGYRLAQAIQSLK